MSPLVMLGREQRAERAQAIQNVSAVVREHFGVGEAEMFSIKRHARIAWVRQVRDYILLEDFKLTCTEAALYVGRHYSTIIYAHKAVRNAIEAYPAVAETVEEVRRKITLAVLEAVSGSASRPPSRPCALQPR